MPTAPPPGIFPIPDAPLPLSAVGDTTATTQSPEPPNERLYLPQLDGLRFFAFLAVFAFHNGLPPFAPLVRDLVRTLHGLGGPFRAIPEELGARWQANGWIGVEIFFVLSGYLIVTLLLREEEQHGRVDLRAFWVRRILRIWPLYYVTLAVALLLASGLATGYAEPSFWEFLSRQGLAFMLFLGNWSMGFRGPAPTDALSVLWSVCVEEQFYLFVPLLLVFIPRRWRVPLALAGIAGGIAGRTWLAKSHAGPLLFQFNTVSHLDVLLGGVLLALLVRPRPGGPPSWSVRGQAAEIVCLGALVLLVSQPGLGKGTWTRQSLDLVGVWVACAGWLGVMVSHRTWGSAMLSYNRLVWLGRISYGLYMWHEIALWTNARLFRQLGWFPNQEPLQAIAGLALTIAFAAASYTWLERPFLRLKSRWTRVASRPV